MCLALYVFHVCESAHRHFTQGRPARRPHVNVLEVKKQKRLVIMVQTTNDWVSFI